MTKRISDTARPAYLPESRLMILYAVQAYIEASQQIRDYLEAIEHLDEK